jgi:hypothetical protein
VVTQLLQSLRGLTLENVTAAVGSSLWKPEIEALLKRRTAIVEFFEDRIKARGAGSVLYAFKEP